MNDSHTIKDLPTLRSLFGPVGEASMRKQVSFLHPTYRRWIEASPFAVLATVAEGGMDASPRGDPAGLVTIENEHTLLLPERRGNNRIDSLTNILKDPRVALLFLIPGVGETMRVSGTATITVEPSLLRRLSMEDKPPLCVVVVKVESVFFQCARAMQRSKLWTTPPDNTRRAVPTAGTMLAALTDSSVGGDAYDSELPARQRATLY